jgi:hypothetical protein
MRQNIGMHHHHTKVPWDDLGLLHQLSWGHELHRSAFMQLQASDFGFIDQGLVNRDLA